MMVAAPVELGVGGVVPVIAAHGLAGSALTFPAAPMTDEAWQSVVVRCAEERLLGHLHAAVASDSLATTPQQRTHAERWNLQLLGRCLLLERHLLAVAVTLEEAGIEHRVLKGAALAHTAYPDPALRQFHDVDVLVRADDLARAVASLAETGHTRQFPEPRPDFDRRFAKGVPVVSPAGLEVDLHRTLAVGPYGFRLRLDELFHEPSSFRIAGRTLPMLPPLLQLLHAACNAALADVPPRLSALRDLAQLLATHRPDPPALIDLAAAHGAAPVLALAVRNTWSTLALAPDDPLARWAHLYRTGPEDRRALRTYAPERRSFSSQTLASLRYLRGVRAKVAFLRAASFPTREFLASRSTTRLSWLRRGRHALLLGRPGPLPEGTDE